MALHASFLIGMIPFGYQWVRQDGLVRTATGVLFAFGLVYFLSLPLRRRFENRIAGVGTVTALSGLAVALILGLVHLQGTTTALAWFGFLGLIVYAALILSNAVLVPLDLWRAFQRAG